MKKWQYAQLTVGLFSYGRPFTRTESKRTFFICGQPNSETSFGSKDFHEIMAQLGEEGWELIEATATFYKSGLVSRLFAREHFYFFKRELLENK